MTDAKRPAKIIKANYMLQAKIGAGPLDEQVVQKCQEVMDNNDFDFQPLAMEFLDKLKTAIDQAQNAGVSKDQAVHAMTAPVMQLKANAATFRYTLIGNLANVMLSFLESIKTIDDDAIQIVSAHHKTLSAIVIKKMQGDGGAIGRQMEDELRAACKRYFSKRVA